MARFYRYLAGVWIQLGTLADWVSGLGSIAAAVVATRAYLREVRDTQRRLKEEESARAFEFRAQASKVFVEAPELIAQAPSPIFRNPRELEPPESFYWEPKVYNNSDSVIHDLTLTLNLPPAAAQMPGRAVPGTQRHFDRLLPGMNWPCRITWIIKTKEESRRVSQADVRGTTCTVYFKDATGNGWEIDEAHNLRPRDAALWEKQESR